jgi:hypothetical protein
MRRFVVLGTFAIAACGDNVRNSASDAAPDVTIGLDAAPDAPAPRRTICVVNADDTVEVFDALQDGDGAPLRRFGRITTLAAVSWAAIDPVHDELYVTDAGKGEIAVFSRTANGGIAPIRRITGVGEPGALVLDTVHDELVVANRNSSNGFITVYARTASGNATPLRVLDTTYAFLYPYGVAVDTVNDEIVATGNNAIAVYPRTATAGVPARTITGAATGLAGPIGVTVDTMHDELLVATGTSSVSAFARTANGNAAPLRTITGPTTGLGNTVGIALVNDELLVSDSTQIATFARTANGNIAPSRSLASAGMLFGVDVVHDEIVTRSSLGVSTFSRAATGSAAPVRTVSDEASGLNAATGIAADLVNDELWVGSPLDVSVAVFPLSGDDGAPLRTVMAPPYSGSVAVDPTHGEVVTVNYNLGAQYAKAMAYDRTATAATPPLRTLTPTLSGAIENSHGGIAVDAMHDELVVTSLGVAPALTTFARTADGNTPPLRAIPIPNEGLYGVAIDPAHDELFLVDAGGASTPAIHVYARTATAGAAPLRSIDIPTITNGVQAFPMGIALDAVHGEVFVTDYNQHTISVYARTASGGATPLRTIAGTSTLLHQPTGVAICR